MAHPDTMRAILRRVGNDDAGGHVQEGPAQDEDVRGGKETMGRRQRSRHTCAPGTVTDVSSDWSCVNSAHHRS